MIGPKALSGDRGPVLTYSQPAGLVSGGGVPKWRLLAGFVVLIVLLSNLPTGGPGAVQADQFSGNSVTCTQNTSTLASFDVQGYGSGYIQFHLTIPSGGSVHAEWEHSSGYVWPGSNYSAGVSGYGEWWTTGNTSAGGTGYTWSGGLVFTVAPGSTGTMRFVIGKLASYGGCFSVDGVQIVLQRTVPGSSGQAPAPSNGQPSLGSESPSPYPSYTPCEVGTLPADCPSPPPGYCWIDDGQYFPAAQATLAPCASAPPSAEPPVGGPNATLACNFTGAGHAWGAYSHQSGSFTFHSGDVVTGYWSGSAAGNYQTVKAMLARLPTGVTLWAGGSPYMATGGVYQIGTYSYTGPTIPGGTITTSTWTYTGTTTSVYLVCEGLGTSTTGSFQLDLYVTAGPDQSATPSYNPYPSPSGWPSYPPLPTFGGFGSFPPFAWPSYPPFTWPSYPPLWSPDPSASPGGINICPTNGAGATPPIVACQTVTSPSPSVGGSLGIMTPDPSGAVAGFDALASALAEKAPFGAVAQVNEALNGAYSGAAGAAFDPCVDVPYLGHELHACIPLEDQLPLLAQWRPLMASLVWLLTALALFAIARGSVGSDE